MVFRLGPDNPVPATQLVAMTARFAISGEGSGSITRTVLNRDLEGIVGIDASKIHKAVGIIKAVPALKETVTPAAPDPVATASSEYMKFGHGARGRDDASVGSVVIGAATDMRDARAADDTATNPDAIVSGLATIAPAATGSAVLDNPVTFSGNFSFMKTLALAVDCSGALTELRKMDGITPTGETVPRNAADFVDDNPDSTNVVEGPLHLCIEVHGTTAIPETAPYTVTTQYRGIANAAFPPQGGTHDLAMICGFLRT